MSNPQNEAAQTATLSLTRRCVRGDESAYDELFAAIYDNLHRRAHYCLRQNASVTLSTTALVHETYLKMFGSQLEPEDQTHFFAIASRAMRQVLMNAARDRDALKRGGGLERVTLSAMTTGEEIDLADVLVLDEALTALAVQDARLAEVVELHFFAGLSHAEIARMQGLSERTVARDWRAARAVLRLRMDMPV